MLDDDPRRRLEDRRTIRRRKARAHHIAAGVRGIEDPMERLHKLWSPPHTRHDDKRDHS